MIIAQLDGCAKANLLANSVSSGQDHTLARSSGCLYAAPHHYRHLPCTAQPFCRSRNALAISRDASRSAVAARLS